jgi:hypothetical protein
MTTLLYWCSTDVAAAYKRQRRNPGVTEVAETALNFVKRFA